MFIDAPAFGGKVMSEITDIMIGDGYEEVTFESAVDADVTALNEALDELLGALDRVTAEVHATLEVLGEQVRKP